MNNWQLAITVGGFIIAIFGATWLNHQLLKSYIDAKFNGLDAKFDGLQKTLDARFAAIDQRFGAIESRLDRIERQLEMIFKPSLPGR